MLFGTAAPGSFFGTSSLAARSYIVANANRACTW